MTRRTPPATVRPCLVAEARCLFRRSDDVGEEHRRQHAIVLQHLSLAGDELLHGGKNPLGVALVVEVVDAVDLDESGVGDVVSEVAPERKRYPRVVATVEDERRHAD